MRTTNYLFTILFIGIFVVLTSCNDKDSPSLGNFKIEIATVDSIDRATYALVLDNGDRLWPAATDVTYLPRNDQRVFVNYTILSENQGGYAYYVKINDIWNILTKDVIDLDESNVAEIGNDPVELNDIWIGGDFLNVDYMFNYGGVRPHWFNLVNNTFNPLPSPDVVELEFRHNAYGSTSTNMMQAFVCFNLKPFRKPETDSVLFSIRVKDGNSDRFFDLVYKYNQTTGDGTTASKPLPVITTTEYR